MSPVIDEEELERIRSGEKDEKKKRNWYTSPERLARVDAALREYGFKSSNKLLDRAVDWYLAALVEARDAKKKPTKK